MTVNLFLLQIVAFSCASFLFQAQVPKGWKFLSGVVLLILSALVVLQIPEAGWISFLVWMGLILLPLLGYARVNRYARREEYAIASRWANRLRWVHPLDGMWLYPQLLSGLALGQQGRLEEAEALFQRYASLKTSNGRLAIALSHRLRSRWDDLLAWLHHLPSEQSILQDQDLAIYYLRSLGETGQVNALLTEVDRFTRRHNRTGNSDLAWLYALAFCGQPDVVRQLLAGSLRHYATSMQQYWSLTAELAAGNGQARGGLIALRSRCDVTVQKAIDWRLSQPLLNLDRVLTDESRRILVGVRAAIAEEENYSNRSVFAQRQAFVTYGLMAMNILIFAVIFIPLIDSAQISPQILTTVVRWFEQGVLIPQRVALGEWWRVISANFLHAGWLHLLANMVGLYFYGTLIESQLGSARFLFAYLFTGIGAMTSVAIVTLYFGDPSQGTVGASGAIMGLLGIFIAILLRGWQREKAAIAGRQLRFALLLVGLQTLSDLLTPQVSLLGHVSGLVLGFLVGWVLKRDRKPRSRLV